MSNIKCGCCGTSNKKVEVFSGEEDVPDILLDDYEFLYVNIPFSTICLDCLNKVSKLTKLEFREIIERERATGCINAPVFRVHDKVLIVNHDMLNPTDAKIYFATIEVFDLENKNYKVKEYPNLTFVKEDFADIINSAYLAEYVNFLLNVSPYKDKIKQGLYSASTIEEYAKIKKTGEMCVDDVVAKFRYAKEFIDYLKDKKLWV